MIPYRDLTPSRSIPVVTLFLIAVNLAVFIYQMTLPRPEAIDLLYRYAAIPLEFKMGHNLSRSMGPHPILNILTASFLHGGLLHLIGNMMYLWIFGDNIEDKLGKIRFVIFYLLCGALSILIQVYADFDSKIPIVGASGAIAGVLGAYLRLFPRGKIVVLIPIFYFLRRAILPAWVVLGGWILIQILSIQLSPLHTQGGVAYYAHIGGFLIGLILLPAFSPSRVKKRK